MTKIGASALTGFADFEFLAELGRGTQSIVYLTEKNGIKAAIKVYDPESSSNNKDAISQEFATLASIRDPGVPEVYEVGVHEDTPYVVIQYIQGQSLADYIVAHRVNESKVLEIAKQLAGSLDVVHRMGVIHRDIKPSNIMVEKTGRCYLIDFGFAKTEDEQNKSESFVGTILYAAPEKVGIIDRVVDARSDLYSIGMILLEIVFGGFQFDTSDMTQILHFHSIATVLPEDTPERTCSPAVRAIIEKLLAKDPDDRYQSAIGVLADLDRLDELNLEFNRNNRVVLGRDDRAGSLYHGKMVGRGRQKQELLGSLEVLRKNHGGVFVIEGVSGMGKTRLAKEACTELSLPSSPRVVLVKAEESKKNNPFHLVKGFIDNLLFQLIHEGDEIEKAEAIELVLKALGNSVALLKSFTPLLATLCSSVQSVATSSVSMEQFYGLLSDFLIQLPRLLGPTVFIVDDIQWVDGDSIAVLNLMKRDLTKTPIFFIVTKRLGYQNQEGSDFENNFSDHILGRVQLTALESPQATELISEQIGGRMVDAEIVEHLMTLTQGNPFALQTYVRTMLQKGLLVPYWGRWIYRKDLAHAINLPTNVIDLLIENVKSLSHETLVILRFAAILGSQFSEKIMRHFCGENNLNFDVAIRDGLNNNVIAVGESDDALVFVHDQIQEAILREIDRGTLQDCHRKLGLHIWGNFRSTFNVCDLARIFIGGDPQELPTEAFQVCLAAGYKSHQEFSPQDAIQYLSIAESLGEKNPGGITMQFYMTKADCYFLLDDYENATIYYKLILDHSEQPLERGHAYLRLGRLHLTLRQVASGIADLNAALSEVGIRYHRHYALDVIATLIHFVKAMILSFMPSFFRKVDEEEQKRYQLLTLIYETKFISSYYDLDFQIMVHVFCHTWFYGLMAGGQRYQSIGYVNASILFAAVGFKSLMRIMSKKAMDTALLLGDPFVQARVKLWQGMSYSFAGEFDESAKIYVDLIHQSLYLERNDYMNVVGPYLWISIGDTRLLKEIMTTATQSLQRTDSPTMDSRYHPYFTSVYGLLAGIENMVHYFGEIEKIRKFHVERNPDDIFGHCHMLTGYLYYYISSDETDDRLINATIDKFYELNRSLSLALYLKHFFVAEFRIRMMQLMRSSSMEQKQEALRLTKRLYRRSLIPLALPQCPEFKSLRLCILALILWAEGKPKKALRCLKTARDVSDSLNFGLLSDIYWLNANLFEELERPRDSLAQYRTALSLSLHDGVKKRINLTIDAIARITGHSALSVGQEIAKTGGSYSSSTNLSRRMTTESRTSLDYSGSTRSNNSIQETRENSRFQTLLKVALKSVSVLDTKKQAEMLLDEVIRVLSADRALLFMLDQEMLAADLKQDENLSTPKGFTFFIGRSSDGANIESVEDYSSTVIETVIQQRKTLIFSGDRNGVISSTESIVSHNLRSIVAAPPTYR